jgi:hypothetical protein
VASGIVGRIAGATATAAGSVTATGVAAGPTGATLAATATSTSSGTVGLLTGAATTATATATATGTVVELGLAFTPPSKLGGFVSRDMLEHSSRHHLFDRAPYRYGMSLLKTAGVYRQVDGPADEDITAADITYLGGHVYPVTTAEAADLTAAGYGAWLTTRGST